METVKVDIQKLQLLNDRITQTIEALNQVRMSVQGIQHTPMSPFGYNPYPGAQLGFAQQFNPYASPFVPQIAPQFVPQFGGQFGGQFGSPYGAYGPGLAHTSPVTTQTPWTQWTPWTANGISHTPWTPWTANGLSQTPWDPANQMRTQQMFPFVQYPTTVS